MSTPAPWQALLLVGASFRLWRLLAEDTILDRPRYWLVRLPRGWDATQTIPANYRIELANFIQCPWCLGFWIGLALWGVWEVWPQATVIASTPMAFSAAIALIAKLASTDTS